jgi:membrane protein implicated in regulation of membrane protease activity
MIVEFIDDSTVRMTVSGDVESLKYTSKGEKVVIQGPDGNKLTMAKRGADLEGDFDGTLIVFKKNN